MRVLFASMVLVLSFSSLASAQGPALDIGLTDLRVPRARDERAREARRPEASPREGNRRDVGARIALQLGVATALGVGAAMGIAYLAYLDEDADVCEGYCLGNDVFAYFMAAPLLPIAGALSAVITTGIGELTGGYGHIGNSFAGLAVGIPVAAGILALGNLIAGEVDDGLPGRSPDAMIASFTLAGVALACAPIIVYAIDDADAFELHDVKLQPGFALTPEGGSVSLSGTF